MYARKVDDRVLDFRVSGYLWNSSLVMEDLQTKSKWSHILGEARSGPLEGKQLEQIPSVMTTWSNWTEQHPDSTVVMMSATSREYFRQLYGNMIDRFVLGVIVKGKAYAWRFDLIRGRQVINVELQGQPAVVAFHRPTSTPRLFHREVGKRTLTFALKEEKMTDEQTGSTWDLTTGKALEGPLKGKYLEPYPAIVSLIDPWVGFHPEGKVFEPAGG